MKKTAGTAAGDIARDLDVPIPGPLVRLGLFSRASLDLPKGVFTGYLRQHRKIESGGRGWGGPFERPAIPGVAGLVAQLLAPANADDELDDLKHDSARDQARAECGNDQPGVPFRHVIVLHSPRHAEQSKDIKRHEGDVEADQPAPECCLSKTFVKPETERLRKPVGTPQTRRTGRRR